MIQLQVLSQYDVHYPFLEDVPLEAYQELPPCIHQQYFGGCLNVQAPLFGGFLPFYPQLSRRNSWVQLLSCALVWPFLSDNGTWAVPRPRCCIFLVFVYNRQQLVQSPEILAPSSTAFSVVWLILVASLFGGKSCAAGLTCPGHVSESYSYLQHFSQIVHFCPIHYPFAQFVHFSTFLHVLLHFGVQSESNHFCKYFTEMIYSQMQYKS